MSSEPPVSCICLTYGRPDLLAEAIYSFLVQDYGGTKELIVLNDYAPQRLAFDDPQVQIVNLPRRFRTVGEKCNAAVALASHDLLFVWDDDDIYLPHRLSLSVERFDPAKGFFKPARGWVWDHGVLSGPTANVFHSASCWSRELFNGVGGYAPMGNGYDQEIEERFGELRGRSTATDDIVDTDVYYIYRWGGTGSYHMSAFGQDEPGQNSEQFAVADFVQAQANYGALREGAITITPRWNMDYVALTRGKISSPSARLGT
jgi:glycosyltransferase involved in cell wall biosynthesis